MKSEKISSGKISPKVREELEAILSNKKSTKNQVFMSADQDGEGCAMLNGNPVDLYAMLLQEAQQLGTQIPKEIRMQVYLSMMSEALEKEQEDNDFMD